MFESQQNIRTQFYIVQSPLFNSFQVQLSDVLFHLYDFFFLQVHLKIIYIL